MSDLVNLLMSNIGIDQKQAEGGLGTILNFAKDKLSEGDFSKVSSLIDGASGLMNDAPAEEKSSGLGGMFGSVTSALGVDTGNLAGLASLAGKLDSLGIDMETAKKFLPIISNFLESKGGDSVKGVFSNLIK